MELETLPPQTPKYGEIRTSGVKCGKPRREETGFGRFLWVSGDLAAELLPDVVALGAPG